MKRIILHPTTAAAVAFGALLLAVVVAFAPSTWITMMLRSFLPLWVLLFVGTAAWLLFRRRWRDGFITAASSLMIAPTIDGDVPPPARRAGEALRIAHYNVLQTNHHYADVIATMLRSDADLISVQEVDPAWAEELKRGLAAAYPHQVIEPRSNCYGIALFGRVPLTDPEIVHLDASPAISVGTIIDGKPVRVLCVHTSSPGSPDHFTARNEQLDRLASVINGSRDPVLVVGDLNAVPWDKDLRRFLASTGMRSHASATDPTFPSLAHLALIPIDHVLSTTDHGVDQRSVHIPGSDHRGLIADIFPVRR
jgi:endonuclease/exonuclease/phosphatase (EEP) superfamily protein YafD